MDVDILSMRTLAYINAAVPPKREEFGEEVRAVGMG
jgi:hypothetical protein